jgi:hypothetical protein
MGGTNVSTKQRLSNTEANDDGHDKANLEAPEYGTSSISVTAKIYRTRTYMIANMNANCKAARPA